jgi:hypothetical protein
LCVQQRRGAAAMRASRLLTCWHGQMASVAPLKRGRPGRAVVSRRRRGGRGGENDYYLIDAALGTSVSGGDIISTERDRTWGFLVVLSGCPRTCPPRIKQAKRQSTGSLQAGASWRRSGVKLRVSAWPQQDSKTPDAALDWLCWSSGCYLCRLNVTCQTCLHGRGRIGDACLTACSHVLAGTESGPALHVK